MADHYMYCPVCGDISLDDKSIEKFMPGYSIWKCSECGAKMVMIEKHTRSQIFNGYDYYKKHTNPLEAVEDKDEWIRQEIVHLRDNPLYDPEKEKLRIQHENERAEERRRGREERRAHSNPNAPRCPTCGSTNIRSIGGLERGVSVAALGLFSRKINKSFKCNNCGNTW